MYIFQNILPYRYFNEWYLLGTKIPRLFKIEDLQNENFRIKTIADITDDMGGSVPCNLGDSTIAEPVYGVDKLTLKKPSHTLQTQ